jgi:hypothetical protein
MTFMRLRASLLICTAIFLIGCTQLYQPTSSNPAFIQVPVVGISNSLNLVAVDGQTMGAPNDRDFWRIDSGAHRLAVVYQGDLLILNARLGAGHHYRIVCETTDVSIKGYVRDLGTNKIVSNIAEQALMFQRPRPMSLPPLQIPAVPR